MIELTPEQEKWERVPDYPQYSVSSHGKVKGPSGKILKPDTIKGGYLRVTLSKHGKTKRFQVHKLVLLCFIGPSTLQGRHLDGNPQNNKLNNLAYGTRHENEQDKRHCGTYQQGENNPFSILTAQQANDVKRILSEDIRNRNKKGFVRGTHGLRQQLASKLGVTVSCIKNIQDGRAWGTA